MMLTQLPDKILIVDDEPDIIQALKLYLDDAGYASAVACGGASALDVLFSEKDYTAILLDINMPEIDGVTVLKRLHDAKSDIAVIMMSGHGSEDLAVECMKNGAEDYISKPFALEDMLQRVQRALAHRRERIEKRQLQQEREDFILMLSHDMKNPLTAVIGSIDIVREGCLGGVNDEQKDYLQSAIDSCNEVVTMIDNLLDIRKFEAAKIQMATQSYNAHELIDKVCSQFARSARYDGIDFQVNSSPCTAELLVDKKSFTRVLGNLLGNSLKFTPEGGTITVSTACISAESRSSFAIPDYVSVPAGFFGKNNYMRLTVRDTGNGIPADELERIFDRFTQLSRKTGREQGGAGLGLAYCKLAIESFHGIIWAESEEEKGSEFIILLPCSVDGSKKC